MPDDTSLLEAARRGDVDAIGRIFDLYSPVLFRYAFHLCRDRCEADRIVGDVFERLLEYFSKGKGPRTNLRPYLFQITYHQLVEHVRDARRLSSLEKAARLPDGRPSVSAQIESREMLQAIEYAMISRLTSEQRHIILLRYVEGLTVAETARVIGKSASAVSVLQNRALERLRKALWPNYGLRDEHDIKGERLWMAA